ncbi:MAG TPA: hypothetical protein VGF43_23855 [Dongiaceae bacterium]|jgi:hypothetical protein
MTGGRRVRHASAKCLAIGAAAAALLSASYGTAFAYLDPGTGSIILQSLIAGIIGSLAFARMYWTRLKDMFRRTFGNRGNDPKNQ